MSDIKFRLGTEAKEFEKGLQDAKKSADTWATSISKDISQKLNRTFGAGDVFKGLLQGLGIGSAEKIADLIVTPWKMAAEHAKELYSWSERSLNAVQRLIRGRRTDEQNLAALLREQSRDEKALRGEQNAMPFLSGGILGGEKREAEKRIAELDSTIKERAVETDDLQKKIDKDAGTRAKELGDAKIKLADAQIAKQREAMTDQEKLVALDLERSKYGLEALNSKTSELERTKAATKEAETQREIAALRKKISEDEAKIAEKAANDQKKRREDAEKLNEALKKARENEDTSRGNLRNARAEQFAFSLSDAQQGTRGSRGGRNAAKLIGQKTGILNQILDAGDYQVSFGDDGSPSLSSRDGTKTDAARQATGRFRKVFNEREALRGGINNLTGSDRNPMGEQMKAVESAVKESNKILEEIKKAKFINQ
jgi:hypothetical protein